MEQRNDAKRTALVTGANSGIGKDTVRQLALLDRYRTVFIGARDVRKGHQAQADLEKVTGKSIFEVLALNLSNAASVRAAVATLSEPIDDLVMNAGGFGGSTRFQPTHDGVVEIVASNLIGHAVLLQELIQSRLLTRAAVLAGSEGARGIEKFGLKKPLLKSGSTEEFVSICDGSYFRREKTSAFEAYGMIKLVGALYMGHQARTHPHLKLLTMSPGGTANTSVMGFLPPPLPFIIKRFGHYLLPLSGLAHRLEDGAKRIVDALLDDRFLSGKFYASGANTLVGPMTDQAEILPELANALMQEHADAAVRRFVVGD